MKDGQINFKEFVEMDKFVQRIRKRVEKETKKTRKSSHPLIPKKMETDGKTSQFPG